MEIKERSFEENIVELFKLEKNLNKSKSDYEKHLEICELQALQVGKSEGDEIRRTGFTVKIQNKSSEKLDISSMDQSAKDYLRDYVIKDIDKKIESCSLTIPSPTTLIKKYKEQYGKIDFLKKTLTTKISFDEKIQLPNVKELEF